MKSYEQMARALSIPYCRGLTKQGLYCHRDHLAGGEAADGTLHFAERQVTRLNTLFFMKLVARLVEPSLATDVPWRRVYLQGVIAREYAARIGLRLVPARLWSADRAFVLAGLAGVPNSVPMRKRAYDWARR